MFKDHYRFDNLIYCLTRNKYALVKIPVCQVPKQRTVCKKDKNVPLGRTFPTLCSVLASYLFILTAAKVLNAQTALGL